MLASRPLKVTPQDDARKKSLKESYNAALRSLQDLQITPETNISVFVKTLTTNARQLIAAEVMLARPDELPRAYEHFIELMKYFDSIEIPNPDGSIDVYHILAISDARRKAELKLLELKRNPVQQGQSKGPVVGATSLPAKAAGSPPAATPEKPAPPVAKASTERLPLLLTRPPLERQAGDDEWHKLLKERFNAAVRGLQASYRRHEVDPSTAATNVIAAARRVLEADLALTSDSEYSKQAKQSVVDAWQRYFELTKFLEQQAEARFNAKFGGLDELEAARKAHLEAELKLLEAQRAKAAPAKAEVHGTTWITR